MSSEVVVYYGLVNNEEKIKPQTSKHKDDHRCKWRMNTMITNIILWGYIKDLLLVVSFLISNTYLYLENNKSKNYYRN